MRWSDQRQILGTLTEFTPRTAVLSRLPYSSALTPRHGMAGMAGPYSWLPRCQSTACALGDGRLLVLPHHRHSGRIFLFFTFLFFSPLVFSSFAFARLAAYSPTCIISISDTSWRRCLWFFYIFYHFHWIWRMRKYWHSIIPSGLSGYTFIM